MRLTDFVSHFRDDQEIGRDSTYHTLEVYYDNGTDVGRIVEVRPSTRCQADLLTPDNADIARQWAKRPRG
jgi:hypothetical protein